MTVIRLILGIAVLTVLANWAINQQVQAALWVNLGSGRTLAGRWRILRRPREHPSIQSYRWHAGWGQSPMREAEGLSRLHNTITDWPDSGYTRRIVFIPGAPPPWP